MRQANSFQGFASVPLSSPSSSSCLAIPSSVIIATSPSTLNSISCHSLPSSPSSFSSSSSVPNAAASSSNITIANGDARLAIRTAAVGAGDVMSDRIDSLTDLCTRLQEFPKHASVPTMLPIGNVAFLAGEFVNTNKVLMDFGSGYFVESTSDEARSRLISRIEALQKIVQRGSLLKGNSISSSSLSAPSTNTNTAVSSLCSKTPVVKILYPMNGEIVDIVEPITAEELTQLQPLKPIVQSSVSSTKKSIFLTANELKHVFSPEDPVYKAEMLYLDSIFAQVGPEVDSDTEKNPNPNTCATQQLHTKPVCINFSLPSPLENCNATINTKQDRQQDQISCKNTSSPNLPLARIPTQPSTALVIFNAKAKKLGDETTESDTNSASESDSESEDDDDDDDNNDDDDDCGSLLRARARTTERQKALARARSAVAPLPSPAYTSSCFLSNSLSKSSFVDNNLAVEHTQVNGAGASLSALQKKEAATTTATDTAVATTTNTQGDKTFRSAYRDFTRTAPRTLAKVSFCDERNELIYVCSSDAPNKRFNEDSCESDNSQHNNSETDENSLISRNGPTMHEMFRANDAQKPNEKNFSVSYHGEYDEDENKKEEDIRDLKKLFLLPGQRSLTKNMDSLSSKRRKNSYFHNGDDDEEEEEEEYNENDNDEDDYEEAGDDEDDYDTGDEASNDEFEITDDENEENAHIVFEDGNKTKQGSAKKPVMKATLAQIVRDVVVERVSSANKNGKKNKNSETAESFRELQRAYFAAKCRLTRFPDYDGLRDTQDDDFADDYETSTSYARGGEATQSQHSQRNESNNIFSMLQRPAPSIVGKSNTASCGTSTVSSFLKSDSAGESIPRVRPFANIVSEAMAPDSAVKALRSGQTEAAVAITERHANGAKVADINTIANTSSSNGVVYSGSDSCLSPSVGTEPSTERMPLSQFMKEFVKNRKMNQ